MLCKYVEHIPLATLVNIMKLNTYVMRTYVLNVFKQFYTVYCEASVKENCDESDESMYDVAHKKLCTLS